MCLDVLERWSNWSKFVWRTLFSSIFDRDRVPNSQRVGWLESFYTKYVWSQQMAISTLLHFSFPTKRPKIFSKMWLSRVKKGNLKAHEVFVLWARAQGVIEILNFGYSSHPEKLSMSGKMSEWVDLVLGLIPVSWFGSVGLSSVWWGEESCTERRGERGEQIREAQRAELRRAVRWRGAGARRAKIGAPETNCTKPF